MGDLVVRCRAAGVLIAVASAWPAVFWLVGPRSSFEPGTVDAGLAWTLGWLLLGCWSWLSLVAILVALETAATGTSSLTGRLAPHGLRLLVATACGAGAVACVAGPAAADPVGGTTAHVTAQLHLLDGLRLPDRALTGSGTPRAPARDSVLVVEPGDTLTHLARRIGVDWRHLYRINRSVIGADPDLIHPGTRLAVPSHTINEGALR